MLKKKKIPITLQEEVLSTSAYVLNRCPNRQLDKLHEKVCTQRKYTIKTLRVFGFLCYKHVPEASSKKLNDRSERMIC